MLKLAYNKSKNTSISHILFQLNYKYFLRVFFKNEINPYSRFFSANKLAKKLKKI